MQYKSVSLLDEGTLQRVQRESLRLLENVGVYVGDSDCVETLKKAGARVDGQSSVVRLPASMVLEAMAQLTGEFDLFGLRGQRLSLPRSRPSAGARVRMPRFLDYGAKENRLVRRQDSIDLCRVTSALPGYEWSVVIDAPACDGQPEIDYAEVMGLAYAIMGHPIMTAPTTEAGMEMCIDLATAASPAGDMDQAPNLLVCVNTASPLQMAREECRVLRRAVEAGVPIDVEPMTAAGATTPFTLAGTLMVENAEVLFMLCLANAVRPGAKVMESTVGSTMNMKGANLSLAAPEALLLASAEAALTRLHGLPVMRMGGYSDPYYLDIQTGIEKSAFTLMIVLSGADLVLMGGPLSNAAHQSCESLIIDHDIWEYVDRCTTEIVVDDSTLAYETAVEVGIGGSYFETEHTLRWLRSGEHYYGGSFDRSGRPGEEYTMLARARARTEEILSRPFEYGSPPEAVERIRRFLSDRAKTLGVEVPEWPAH
jgi:trimethylamine--corrinoid protein Co-methyltransferase